VINMGIRLCPPLTLPNEQPECEQRRQDFENANPQTDLDFNLEYWFFNREDTLAEAASTCASLGSNYRFATVQELAFILFEIQGELLCPMLVWATLNGEPTLTFVTPQPERPNIVIPVFTPSPFCRAFSLCVLNLA
jgi:hypothetical protein